jgi:hypothetical protein
MGSVTERELLDQLTQACHRVCIAPPGLAKLNLARQAY